MSMKVKISTKKIDERIRLAKRVQGR